MSKLGQRGWTRDSKVSGELRGVEHVLFSWGVYTIDIWG